MNRPRIAIAIANRQRTLPLDRAALRAAVRTVLRGEGVEVAEVSLAFVTDAEIAELNWRFLRHEGPTDVITFPLSDPEATPLAAEIVISVETALREAKRRGLPVERELALYVVHAALHMCGYDDQTALDRRRMRARERKYLRELTTERTRENEFPRPPRRRA
jgi:probable rRNA maturation factor